jgi:hypothetical protein
MSKAAFRILLILIIVTATGGEIISLTSIASLPESVQAYIRSSSGVTAPNHAIRILSAAGLLLTIVAFVGLFLFWRPARQLFVLAWLLARCISLFLGATFESAWAATLGSVSDSLEGIVIALIFFSPVANFFEKRRVWFPNLSEAMKRAEQEEASGGGNTRT